jgi:hypothetical protein
MARAGKVAARHAGRVLLRALAVVCASSSTAFAQAWVPPAGIGVVTVVYQTIDNTGHRLTDGSIVDGYDSASRGVLLNLDYAVTDQFSFSLGVPYVAAKYTGPEPSFFGLPIDDCLCWNHGWQDFGLTARYNVANGAFALTPSVSFGLPTHDYDYFGEAVLGRNLRELRIAVEAGRRFDRISDRLSVSARYAYAFVEKVLDLANNRSNISLEPGYLVTRRLLVRAAFSWQRSHGGLRSTEFATEEQLQQFDRLLKDNSFHVGGGVSYSLSPVDVFASFIQYANGTDTHAGRAITAGLSWPFER